MNELTTTAALVKAILEQDEKTRNSDSFLYFKVLEVLGAEKNIDINSIPITAFLISMSEWGFPPFESVRRTRQKVQQHYPHLASTKAVKKARSEREETFKNFALLNEV